MWKFVLKFLLANIFTRIANSFAHIANIFAHLAKMYERAKMLANKKREEKISTEKLEILFSKSLILSIHRSKKIIKFCISVFL